MSINQCKRKGAEGNMVIYGLDCIEPGVTVIDGPLKPALAIFKAARLQVMVCTSSFGIGNNVTNIDLVTKISCPSSVEELLQKFGQAR